MDKGNDTQNAFSGDAHAVVQSGEIHGDVHIHQPSHPVLQVPRQLPFDVPDFTGRADELRQLDMVLTAGKTVVISAISGTPGVGKTAMAIHWAHRESDRFPDGQLYVNLRGFDATPPMPAQQALDAFVRALGAAPERIPEQVDALSDLYRAMVVHDEVGDRWSASRTMTGLGEALHAVGAVVAAVDCWRKALVICEELDDSSAAEEIRALLHK